MKLIDVQSVLVRCDCYQGDEDDFPIQGQFWHSAMDPDDLSSCPDCGRRFRIIVQSVPGPMDINRLLSLTPLGQAVLDSESSLLSAFVEPPNMSDAELQEYWDDFDRHLRGSQNG